MIIQIHFHIMSNGSRASAIGAPPFYGVDGSNRYVESSNLTPSFPSTECLRHGTFKVVVGSWRRLNEATTNTNDFAVNVSAYAPKTTPVTRVTLVDVDIPPTQHLIEDPWCRVYFDNGMYTTPDCRVLEVGFSVTPLNSTTSSLISSSASVVLPLHFDAITTYTLLPGSSYTVRLFTAHRAPYPIASVVNAWAGLASRGCGALYLIGVPGVMEFSLNNVVVADDSTMSFDVQSRVLYDALRPPHNPSNTALFLSASPIPNPQYLAAILSRCMSDALLYATYVMPCLRYNSCGNGGNGGNDPEDGTDIDCPVRAWRFELQYAPTTDKYTLSVLPPEPVRDVTLAGSVAAFLGFGSPYTVPVTSRHTVTHTAQNAQYHAPSSYASIAVGSPKCGTTFAAWIQAAFDALCWRDGFRFAVTLPGFDPQVVTVPGGTMTLVTLADVVQQTLVDFAPLPYASITVRYAASPNAAASGLVFSSTTVAFGLDFSIDVGFAPVRIGYDARAYAAANTHYPTRRASHCPDLAAGLGIGCGCTPPRANTRVVFRPDTQELVLDSTPFPSFKSTVDGIPTSFVGLVVTSDTAQALQVGAVVILGIGDTLATYSQCRAYVCAVASAFTFTVVFVDTNVVLPAIGTTVIVVPQDRPPLNLYLQRSFVNGVPPEVIGFQARTYSACCELVSPGTVDVRQDPYILLCLGFESPTATPLTGDVYYPFLATTQNQLVFAKVARSAGCIYRTDFDKTFDHTFYGSGTTLGYIRVQVLNSDGSPYQTHGHPVSITLKFDSRESAVAFGDGTVSIGTGDNMGESQLVLGGGRGMIRPPLHTTSYA